MTEMYKAAGGPAPDAAGLAGVTLSSPGGLSISFVPDAGMVGCSFTHHGEQLLGLRGGMQSYLQNKSTFGLPLLAPWANRLESDIYEFEGREVSVKGVPGIHRDAAGRPIHGLLAAASGWRIREASGNDQAATLVAVLDFNYDRPEFSGFPFPHELTVAITLCDPRLTITTTVTPTSEQSVPIAFGWHPYFQIPGVSRDDWLVHNPFDTELELDADLLPTGTLVAATPNTATLAGRELDTLYGNIPSGTQAWVEGGNRRITMTYESGYPFGVLYAPQGANFLAIEPMTAPTNPFAGLWPLGVAGHGEEFSATFTVTVTPAGVDAA